MYFDTSDGLLIWDSCIQRIWFTINWLCSCMIYMLTHLKINIRQVIFYMWNYNYITTFNKTKYNRYFKSCRNNSYWWSKSKMCVIEINNPTHPENMWLYFKRRDPSNIMWKQSCRFAPLPTGAACTNFKSLFQYIV